MKQAATADLLSAAASPGAPPAAGLAKLLRQRELRAGEFLRLAKDVRQPAVETSSVPTEHGLHVRVRLDGRYSIPELLPLGTQLDRDEVLLAMFLAAARAAGQVIEAPSGRLPRSLLEDTRFLVERHRLVAEQVAFRPDPEGRTEHYLRENWLSTQRIGLDPLVPIPELPDGYLFVLAGPEYVGEYIVADKTFHIDAPRPCWAAGIPTARGVAVVRWPASRAA